MTNEQPNIKFTKVLRDCGHNADIQSGARKGRLIYDYNVTIDGELRAVFEGRIFERKYALFTPNPLRESLKSSPTGYNDHALVANRKDDFEGCVKAWLEKGFIPTVAEIAGRKTAKDTQIKKEAELLEEMAKASRVRNAAPKLLAALQAVVDGSFYGSSTGYQHLNVSIMKTVKDAIESAK